MSIQRFVRVVGVSALALGFAFVGGAGVSAEENDTFVTIHQADCYAGVGAAIFEACHEHPVEELVFGIIVDEGVPELGMTDAEGHVGWEWTGGGSVQLGGNIVGDGYVGAYAYCRDLVSDDVLYDGSAPVNDDGHAVIAFETEPGMDIVCDWYDIAADGPDVPADGPALPNTGAGVMAGDSAPFAAMIATGLLALAGAAAMRRHAA